MLIVSWLLILIIWSPYSAVIKIFFVFFFCCKKLVSFSFSHTLFIFMYWKCSSFPCLNARNGSPDESICYWNNQKIRYSRISIFFYFVPQIMTIVEFYVKVMKSTKSHVKLKGTMEKNSIHLFVMNCWIQSQKIEYEKAVCEFRMSE